MKLVKCYWRTDRVCPHPVLCHYGYECVASPKDRARRLARLSAHGSCWPRTVAQVAPMARAMGDELAAELGDDHPHVRWLRGK